MRKSAAHVCSQSHFVSPARLQLVSFQDNNPLIALSKTASPCDILAVRPYMRVVFDWDRSKARVNLAKHSITFEEARTVFLDPRTITERDENHSEREERLISIGMSGSGRLLTVIHAETYESPNTWVVRLISARKVTTAERRKYEQQE